MYYRQIEDNRRSELEEELQKAVAVDDDIALTLNGKLLAERLISTGTGDFDQVSVCSCSCLDLKNHKYSNNEGLVSMNLQHGSSYYISSLKQHVDLETLAL